MTLQQLKYAVMAAEKGTISEAAKALYISQPSLTNAIKELEKEMQIVIFKRSSKGIVVSNEGDQFLGYARQILEQSSLLEEKYKNGNEVRQRFSVSTQHYSFAVNAFVDLVREFGKSHYDFILRETQTNEIIEDVQRGKSEIGILYLSKANEVIIINMIARSELKFEELYKAEPHVFISARHPLAAKSTIELEELEEYPYLSFEQGDYNSFYFSEEILSTYDHDKNIKVRDRATLFNLVIGLNGYTISSGVIDSELNGDTIIAKPLNVEEYMKIGIISQKNSTRSRLAEAYLEALKRHVG